VLFTPSLPFDQIRHPLDLSFFLFPTPQARVFFFPLSSSFYASSPTLGPPLSVPSGRTPFFGFSNFEIFRQEAPRFDHDAFVFPFPFPQELESINHNKFKCLVVPPSGELSSASLLIVIFLPECALFARALLRPDFFSQICSHFLGR